MGWRCEHGLDAQVADETRRLPRSRGALRLERDQRILDATGLRTGAFLQKVLAAPPDPMHLFREVHRLKPGAENARTNIACLRGWTAAYAHTQESRCRVRISLASLDRHDAILLDRLEQLRSALLAQRLSDELAEGMHVLTQRLVPRPESRISVCHALRELSRSSQRLARAAKIHELAGVAELLLHRLDPGLTPAESRDLWARIGTEVTAGWQTEDHPREKLTVADEREHVLFYLSEVLYRVVPTFYEEIADALEKLYRVGGQSLELPTILSFGSWVGGDMDEQSRRPRQDHPRDVRPTAAGHRQGVLRRLSGIGAAPFAKRKPYQRLASARTAHR